MSMIVYTVSAALVFVFSGLLAMAGLGAAFLFVPLFYYLGVPLSEFSPSVQILLYCSSAGIPKSRAAKFPTIRKAFRFIPRPSQYFSKSTLPRCMLRPGCRISMLG